MTSTAAQTPLPYTPSPADRALRALAVAACVPYIGLKAAWLAGSRLGIPEGSALLDHPGAMAVANSVTLLMDAAVVVLALLLTQRWGIRVRAWLPAFPMWVATGLLVPIVVWFTADLLTGLLVDGGGKLSAASEASDPFLDAWVFPVVYGGFIVQALALGALFVRYARRRWGHVWRGTAGELPAAVSGPGVRVTALVASLALLLPAALHLAWALGMTEGLPSAGGAERNAGFAVQEALRVLYMAAAVAGVLPLVVRRGRSLPVWVPLCLAWTGSGAVACWGGWMTLVGLLPVTDPDQEPTALLTLAYAGQMITGLALGACVALFLLKRARRTA